MPDAPRIHWFSPLAPARTDIAHYTGRLLPALSARAAVTLWTSQPHWYSGLARHATVRRFDPREIRWEAIHEADAVFYNIGNDARFHNDIASVARRFPGFSILHDVLLHDSLTYDFKRRNDRASYLDVMQSVYGARGRRDGELYWKGVLGMHEMGRAYSCAPYFLGASLGAIVHSRAAERALAKEVDVPVIRLPLPFPARRRPPNRLLPAPPWKLVVFGFLGANRCLEQILTALAQVPDLPFHLHIYGEDCGGLAALRERLRGDEPRDAARLRTGIRAGRGAGFRAPGAQSALPDQGRGFGQPAPHLEPWAAQPGDADRLVYRAARRYGVVRAAGVSGGGCVRASAGLCRLSAGYVEEGLRGCDYFVERHSPASYAAQIVELAAKAPAYRQRWNALRMSNRAVEGLKEWLPAEQVGGYVERVAEVVGELSLI